jgi:hypothetical protein
MALGAVAAMAAVGFDAALIYLSSSERLTVSLSHLLRFTASLENATSDVLLLLLVS